LFDLRGLIAPVNAASRRHGGFGAFAPHRGGTPSPHPIALLGWGGERYMVLMMALMLDVTLVLMLLCFFPFHACMVCKNETTIEGKSKHTSSQPRSHPCPPPLFRPLPRLYGLHK
jgi:hypothetical protein